MGRVDCQGGSRTKPQCEGGLGLDFPFNALAEPNDYDAAVNITMDMSQSNVAFTSLGQSVVIGITNGSGSTTSAEFPVVAQGSVVKLADAGAVAAWAKSLPGSSSIRNVDYKLKSIEYNAVEGNNVVTIIALDPSLQQIGSASASRYFGRHEITPEQ